MDVMALRRGLLAMANSGLSIKTTTVTVDQSGITNALQVAQFFANKLNNPIALLTITHLDEVTDADEFMSFEYNYDGLFKTRNYRWRNSSTNSFSWATQNYDCVLVSGRRYECTYIG